MPRLSSSSVRQGMLMRWMEWACLPTTPAAASLRRGALSLKASLWPRPILRREVRVAMDMEHMMGTFLCTSMSTSMGPWKPGMPSPLWRVWRLILPWGQGSCTSTLPTRHGGGATARVMQCMACRWMWRAGELCCQWALLSG